jgi:hypothetical protein
MTMLACTLRGGSRGAPGRPLCERQEIGFDPQHFL